MVNDDSRAYGAAVDSHHGRNLQCCPRALADDLGIWDESEQETQNFEDDLLCTLTYLLTMGGTTSAPEKHDARFQRQGPAHTSDAHLGCR